MTIFHIQTYKVLDDTPDREFTNAYFCEATDLTSVATALADFVEAERALFLDNVRIVRARVSDLDPSTSIFQVVETDVQGNRNTISTGSYLPLFNTIRVDINVDGGGRPSRKYYRSPILETDMGNGNLVDSVIEACNAAVNNLISVMSGASCPLVDPDGQTLVSASTKRAIAMRQLHRKRRKATTGP